MLRARIKETEDGFVISGGPSEKDMRLSYGEKLVPAVVTYGEAGDTRFVAFTGPTITVAEDGESVLVEYGTEVRGLDEVKAKLSVDFPAVFDEIDKRSTRAVRSITTAQVAGETPHPKDVETAVYFEKAAVDNRAVLADIMAAESVEYLQANAARLVPVTPWITPVTETEGSGVIEAPVV